MQLGCVASPYDSVLLEEKPVIFIEIKAGNKREMKVGIAEMCQTELTAGVELAGYDIQAEITDGRKGRATGSPTAGMNPHSPKFLTPSWIRAKLLA